MFVGTDLGCDFLQSEETNLSFLDGLLLDLPLNKYKGIRECSTGP